MLLLLLLSLSAYTQTPPIVSVNEDLIVELVKKGNPSTQEIELRLHNAQLTEKSLDDQYSYELVGKTSYYKTSEQSLNAFAPVTSPIKSYKVGIQKNLSTGMSLALYNFAEQTNNQYVRNGTTTGVGVSFQMDLFKDFLGKTTSSQMDANKLGKERAQLLSIIQKKGLLQSIRKVYWALIANEESLRISRGLLKTAERQAADARKRFRNKIADSGTVARYESQVAARKATILSYQYRKENLFQQLKELIPELSHKNLELGEYNVDQTLAEVITCTSQIKSEKNIPLNYTYYDEFLSLLKEQYQKEKVVTDSYNQWDIQFSSELNKIGKKEGFSEAWDQFQDGPKTSYQLGLSFNIPLGSRKKDTEDVKHLIEKKKYLAEKESTMSKIVAYHTQTARSVQYLHEVVKNQKINAAKLSHSLQVTEKKYKQARASVSDLISDQDAYLQSSLSEIDTKLAVINTLLDYFSVFTEIPCELNKTL